MSNIADDRFFEISTQKDGDKYLVNDVTSTYLPSGIKPIINYDSDASGNVYSLDGRLVRTDGKLENLPKGIYIVNKKKIILK